MAKITRRSFLAGGAAGFAGATTALGLLNRSKAWAADTTGYRALVCVFLFGGLDHADTVFPFSQGEYDQLANLRAGLFNAYNGQPSTSRARDNLLQITPANASAFGGREFALSPQMPEMQNLFESGEMAIVGNVGPLVEPTDRDSFDNQSVVLPPRLFSHNDQQSSWMALDVEGAQLGWGGQFADAVLASDANANPLFTSITTSNSIFLAGNTSFPFFASVNGGRELELNIVEQEFLLGGNDRFNAQRQAVENYYNTTDFGSLGVMQRDFTRMAAQGIENNSIFQSSLESIVPFATIFPEGPLGNQLNSVAEAIQVGNAMNVSRQIFFVGIGGFDTHSNQASRLPGLQAQISGALMAFRNAMIERNLWNGVTVFTGSDFGRTVIDNGDGTDHGWGAHHFVLGGSVQGGNIYGDIPSPDIDSQFYTPTRGRLIPTTSVERYAATLGRWFGLSEAELSTALPKLTSFGDADLGVFGSIS